MDYSARVGGPVKAEDPKLSIVDQISHITDRLHRCQSLIAQMRTRFTGADLDRTGKSPAAPGPAPGVLNHLIWLDEISRDLENQIAELNDTIA